MRLDLAGEVGVHGSLRCRTDGNRLLQIRLSALGNPCYLGSETLEMLFFSLQVVGADENREVGIADFQGLKLSAMFCQDGRRSFTLIFASNQALMFSQMA